MATVTLTLVDAWELFDPRLSASGDLVTYLRAVLTKSTKWFEATGGSIFLSSIGGIYSLAAQVGPTKLPQDATIHFGVGVAGTAIETGKPMIVNDPRKMPALKGRVKETRESIGSALVIPLVLPETGCVGVLNLSRCKGCTEFDEEDLARARAVAHQVALAVGNKLLLDQAHESGEQLKSVVDSLDVAVCVLDAEGNIQVENARTRTLRMEGVIDQILSRFGREGRHEIDGRVYWVQQSPAASGAVIAVYDLTEHERSREESSRLKRLAEIGQMAAAIAHDIRNPLTGIRTAAQMIPQIPEQAKELADMIEEEVVRLNRLCEEFLELARPMDIKKKRINLTDPVSRVCRLVEREYEAAGVQLRVEFPLESPTIHADAMRIEQAMRNVLRNALQACKPGGAVTVTVDQGQVTVTDDGCGMSQDAVEHAGTPFFTTKAQGTGLGLSNVRKIVEAHKGKLTFKSGEGQGTTVIMQFPIEDSK